MSKCARGKALPALSQDWPVLRRYDQDHLARIALPLGGIGTGTVSLGGRGDLRDWEIVNRPAKGFTPTLAPPAGVAPFFALWTRDESGRTTTRALEGPIPEHEYEGASGCPVPNASLPRFRDCAFEAAYPLGQVLLSDPKVPLRVRLQAFNPLIPGDADASGIPVAVLRYVLTNRTSKPVRASVCGTLLNFIGADGSPPPTTTWDGRPDHASQARSNRNLYKKDAGVQGVFMLSDGVPKLAQQWGTMALATTSRAGVTCRTNWADLSWGNTLLDFWDEFSADGKLGKCDESSAAVQSGRPPIGSLAVSLIIPPRGQKAVTFLLTWHFPNRKSWGAPAHLPPAPEEEGLPVQAECCPGGMCDSDPEQVGNYYATRYRDAWDVAASTAADLKRLEEKTIRFVGALAGADLPEAVKEAALFNISTLRSQTTFRTADGYLFGWEGCHDRIGCCHGSCTHVWNYENTLPFLFGDLSRGMREVEFLHATDDQGLMSFRVNLPLGNRGPTSFPERAAADGQMGCLMRLYRDWKLSGDDAWLKRLWPRARKALEFCWIEGGWDADADGVMEGCQHNTMDVEYYGPNPQMGTWYLGALRAMEEMARHLGEEPFASRCRELFEKGRAWLDAELFNGDYYEHRIVPPTRTAGGEYNIAPSLIVGMGARDLDDPELQLGAGCLIDQLVGQYMAHICGLGYLLDSRNVRRTLRTLMKHNFQRDLFGHFNHLRTYVLNDEPAMVMATYPRGRRPRRPFPYYNEVMTGFEYTAAIGMLFEGQRADGLKVIRSIRQRYDGRKRSPFNEAECGHHYARAMAAWGAVIALTGFHHDGIDHEMTFAAAGEPVTWFWSNGSAWGTLRQRPAGRSIEAELTVLHGEVLIQSLRLAGWGQQRLDRPVALKAESASPRLSVRLSHQSDTLSGNPSFTL